MKNKKSKLRNPFQFGVVIDENAFCNRKAEIEFLKNQINNAYSTWVYFRDYISFRSLLLCL